HANADHTRVSGHVDRYAHGRIGQRFVDLLADRGQHRTGHAHVADAGLLQIDNYMVILDVDRASQIQRSTGGQDAFLQVDADEDLIVRLEPDIDPGHRVALTAVLVEQDA